MTATTFSSTSVLTQKRWTQRMYYDSISDDTLPGQLKSYGVLKTEDVLSREAGDNVKIHFLQRQSGKGQRGMAARTGNEVALQYFQHTFNIDNLESDPIQIPNTGTIDAQRVSFDLQEDTYQVLKNWDLERKSVACLNQLAGYYPTSLTYDGVTVTGDDRLNYLGLNAGVAPSSGYIFRPGSNTTDQAVNADTTATLKMSHIDTLVDAARTTRPYIEKIDRNGINYLFYVHVKGFRQLMQDTTSPFQQRDIILAKIAAGAKDEELLGEAFQYNETLVICSDKLPYGVHSGTSAAQTNVRRGVFVGKNALAMAYGKGFSDGKETVASYKFDMDFWDINKYKRYVLSSIYGISKVQWNSTDYGVMVFSHYVS
jgi:hypothetical protein